MFYLLYTCEMLDTKLYQVQDWKKFVHVFIIASHPLRGGEGHKILPLGTKYFVSKTLQKGKNWKFFSQKENKLACFTNS